MKKVFLYALCFISLLTVLTGCKKKEITDIEVTNFEEVVLKGTELKGLKVTTIFDDDTKSDPIDVTAEMITGYDKNKTGSQEITVKYEDKEYKYTIYVADKIIKNATELRTALKEQKDGEFLALKSGTYNLDRDEATKYGDQTGWYFLITANKLTIRGFGNVVIKSTTESDNGAWASQNFVTIAGNNTTIENVTLQSKKTPNKVVEILGKDTTIRDVKVEPIDTTKFAGSIYLSTSTGNTTLENVTLKYGRISTTAAAGSTLTLKNVTINFAGATLGTDDVEKSLWGFDNSRSKIKVTATSSKIIVSKGFKAADNYKTFTDQLPSGLTVEEAK